MNYQVKVQDKIFEVMIEDLHSRPIIVSVDGEQIEVWVEYQNGGTQIKSVEVAHNPAKTKPGLLSAGTDPLKMRANGLPGNNKAIRAPIPGAIISVTAHQGMEVTIGQQLCVLEAMKMKNAIRSPRMGVIASVHVIPGQTVQHQDVLFEFVD